MEMRSFYTASMLEALEERAKRLLSGEAVP